MNNIINSLKSCLPNADFFTNASRSTSSFFEETLRKIQTFISSFPFFNCTQQSENEIVMTQLHGAINGEEKNNGVYSPPYKGEVTEFFSEHEKEQILQKVQNLREPPYQVNDNLAYLENLLDRASSREQHLIKTLLEAVDSKYEENQKHFYLQSTHFKDIISLLTREEVLLLTDTVIIEKFSHLLVPGADMKAISDSAVKKLRSINQKDLKNDAKKTAILEMLDNPIASVTPIKAQPNPTAPITHSVFSSEDLSTIQFKLDTKQNSTHRKIAENLTYLNQIAQNAKAKDITLLQKTLQDLKITENISLLGHSKFRKASDEMLLGKDILITTDSERQARFKQKLRISQN